MTNFFCNYIALIACVALSIPGSQQKNASPSYLCWSEGIRLNWGDFRLMTDSLGTSSAKAACATKIESFFSSDKGLPNYRISNVFDKSSSWTLDISNSSLLQHEQLHFDISELFARQIRKGIEELRIKKVADRHHYDLLITSKFKERDSYQADYDRKTLHGAIDIIQHEWEKKIKDELAQLSNYCTTSKDCNYTR